MNVLITQRDMNREHNHYVVPYVDGSKKYVYTTWSDVGSGSKDYMLAYSSVNMGVSTWDTDYNGGVESRPKNTSIRLWKRTT